MPIFPHSGWELTWKRDIREIERVMVIGWPYELSGTLDAIKSSLDIFTADYIHTWDALYIVIAFEYAVKNLFLFLNPPPPPSILKM